MREAVSIKIINRLLEEGATVVAYGPVAICNAKKIFSDKIKYAPSAHTCISNADCCIIVTEWEEFKKSSPEDFAKNKNQLLLMGGEYTIQRFQGQRFFAVGLARNSDNCNDH